MLAHNNTETTKFEDSIARNETSSTLVNNLLGKEINSTDPVISLDKKDDQVGLISNIKSNNQIRNKNINPKISASTNLSVTKHIRLSLQVEEDGDDDERIAGFNLSPAEMDVWRRIRSSPVSSNKAPIRIQHLDRCITDNILCPWALSITEWPTQLFSEDDQKVIVDAEKENAIRHMTLVRDLLLTRVENENVKSTA